MNAKSKRPFPAAVITNRERERRSYAQNDQWVMLYTRDCFVRVALTIADVKQGPPWRVRDLGDHCFISIDENTDDLITRIGQRVRVKLANEVRARASGFKRTP